jgi:hypothetical protein
VSSGVGAAGAVGKKPVAVATYHSAEVVTKAVERYVGELIAVTVTLTNPLVRDPLFEGY